MSNKTNLQVLNDTISSNMIELSISYAHLYKDNPRVWIDTFKKYKSVRMACAWIVWSYKYMGIYDECKESGKDFTDYSKNRIEERWVKVFADMLLIIYAIIHNKPQDDVQSN